MLVGREPELQQLNAAYAQMLAGRGSVLFLTGEAGLGKTTLVHEWWNLPEDRERRAEENFAAQSDSVLRSHSSSLFLEAACSIPIGNVDIGRLEALQPWADIISQLDARNDAGVGAHGGAPLQKIDLKKLLHDSAPAWIWALPIVGDVGYAITETIRNVKEQRNVAAHSSAPRNEQSHLAQNQQQVFQQYVNLLAKLSQETPLVIFLDDLHWADTSSCNLLFYLSRQITDKKILVIATYRQDDAMQAQEGKGHAIITIKNEILRYKTGDEITLSYLTRKAIRTYLSALFPAYAVNDNFERWLEKISDGNSLFMTQFVQTLREDGHLDSAGAFVGEYDTITVPKSALAVVEERTRRLDDSTRNLLTYATAEGEEFTSYVLQHLSERKPMDLLADLHRAAKQGMIFEKGKARMFANTTTAVFGFSHALFHKALYDQLFAAQKDFLHHQCFELLKTEWERLTGAKSRSIPLGTKLLTHAEKCDEWETAADVAFALAVQSERAAAHDEAQAMVERCLLALTHAENKKLYGDAKLLAGRIFHFSGKYEESFLAYADAYVFFEHSGATERCVDALNGMASARMRQSRYDESRTHATDALERSKRAGYQLGEAQSLVSLGNVMHALADFSGELEIQKQALEIFQAIHDVDGEAHALGNIGNVYFGLSEYELALEHHKKSIAMYESLGDVAGLARALGNTGIVHYCLANYSESLAYQEKSRAMRVTVGDRLGEAVALVNIGIVHDKLGAYADALAYLEKSLSVFEALHDRYGEALALGNIGNVYHSLGEYKKSLGYLEQSLAIREAIGDRSGMAHAHGNIGTLHRLMGNLDLSRLHSTRALALAKEIHAKNLEADAHCELGLLCEAEAATLTGNTRAAKLREAIEKMEIGIAMNNELHLSEHVEKYSDALTRMKTILISER